MRRKSRKLCRTPRKAGESRKCSQRTKIILINRTESIHSTVVVIAHKLQSIRNADYISVIEGGQLVETGSHDELVEKSSRYYDIIKSQL